MIVITKVEMAEVEGHEQWRTYIRHMKTPEMLWKIGTDYAPVDCEFTDEMVEGKMFKNQKGELLVIGIAGEAAKVLGLEYLAWQELENRYNCAMGGHRKALVERDKWRGLYYGERNMFHHVLYRYVKFAFFGVPSHDRTERRAGKQGSL